MTLTKDEESILLYLETCLVDQRGKVEGKRMNQIDLDIIEKWKEQNILDFGRLPFAEIEKRKGYAYCPTHWVQFTSSAWEMALRARRKRAERHVDTLNNGNLPT